MRGRVLTAALAAAAVALPSYASPVPPPARHARAPLARPGLDPAERARLLARLPVLARADHDPNARDFAALVAAGDLDGDGGADLVDHRSRLSAHPATGLGVVDDRLEILRGRDGRLLWAKPLPVASLHVPFVSRVGPRNGVVVVSYGGGLATYDTVVTAYDAAGAQVWTRTFPGVSPPVPGGVRTSVDGLVGADLLVTTRSTTGVSLTQVSLVSGATGEVRTVGEPVKDPFYGLRAVPVGDLDGDRVDDVVLADAEETARGSVTALSMRTGTPLWSSGVLPSNDRQVVRGIPDATGDGVRDVTVAASTMRLEEPVPAEVVLLDGARGATAWRRPGDGAVAIGDVDGRRGTEVAVGLRGDARLTLTAYDGRGAARWRVVRALPADEAIHTEADWYDAGDVGPDGVREVGFRIVSRDNDRERRDRGLVDGRTGRVLLDAVPAMATSVLPIDGRGSDSFVASGPGFTLAAYRSNTAQRLWSVQVTTIDGAYGALTVDVDGDRCAEVVLLGRSGGALVDVVVSGATGRPLWQVTRWHHEPGRVRTPPAVEHRRYVRTC